MFSVALPNFWFSKVRNFFGTTPGAFDLATRPTQFHHELSAMLEVGKVQNCVSKRCLSVHDPSMRLKTWYVKYIIALDFQNIFVIARGTR
jgi:hypothetical protein